MAFTITGLVSLVVLSTIMAIFTYIFGLLPLHLKSFKKSLDQRHAERQGHSNTTTDYDSWLDKFSKLSNGVLIGTSLVLVIPEGISSMHLGSNGDDTEGFTMNIAGFAILLGFAFMMVIENIKAIRLKDVDENGNVNYYEDVTDESALDAETLSKLQNITIGNFQGNGTAGGGFLPLFLPQEARVSKLIGYLPNFKPTWGNFKLVIVNETFLIGLLLHSVSDGIAFGSSLLTGSNKLKIAVFSSVIIHKFPTSFAMACVLMTKYRLKYNNNNNNNNNNNDAAAASSSSFSRVESNIQQIVKLEMFLFAALASVAAIATYVIINLFVDNIGSLSSALLLFSGGSFLYVAVHLLNNEADHVEGMSSHKITVREKKQSIILNFVGMLIPFCFSFLGDE